MLFGEKRHRSLLSKAHNLRRESESLQLLYEAKRKDHDETEAQLASLQTALGRLREETYAKLESQRARLAKLVAALEKTSDKLISDLRLRRIEDLNANADSFESRLAASPAHYGSWTSPGWANWWPSSPSVAKRVRIGHVLQQTPPDARSFELPAFADLIGGKCTLVIESADRAQDKARATMHALLLRIACLMPHEAEFVLLDPSGLGQAFPMRGALPRVRESSLDAADPVTDLLKEVVQDIRRAYEELLDVHTKSFEDLSAPVREVHAFKFIFAADFPNRYDRSAIELLQLISANGTHAGCYIVLEINASASFPRDLGMDGFSEVHRLPKSFKQKQITLDGRPSPEILRLMQQRLQSASTEDRILPWHDVAALPKAEWWKGTATERIETPIGVKGGSDALKIWFGADRDRRSCVHGMLAGMPGSGKSNLYHVLILGLSLRYGPDELRLYLIDGKDGVEFAPYRHLPHAEIVSLHSLPELSRSILVELMEEMDRRNNLFKECQVRDFPGYRKAASTHEKLPRILVLVDEFHELFEDDRLQQASEWLLQLVRQTRNTGIHILLGSQRFGAPGMVNQSAIFTNIHLRMSMGIAPSEVTGMAEFETEGRQLIRRCKRPGQIVVNDNSGGDGSNSFGKVAWIDEHKHQRMLADLDAFADNRKHQWAYDNRIVFDGLDQPRIAENPIIHPLLARQTWPTDAELQAFANGDVRRGGWGLDNWNPAEHPVLCVLGQQFNVRHQLVFAFLRRPNHNLAVVGDRLINAVSLIAGCLVSAIAIRGSHSIAFDVINISSPTSPSHALLSYMHERLLIPLGYQVKQHENAVDPGPTLFAINREIDERQASQAGAAAPSHFLVIFSPDRAESLKQTERHSDRSVAGQHLIRILNDGPEVGIHTIIFSESARLLDSVVDLQRRPCILHRVAFQMNETESFRLLGTQAARQLQKAGERPIAALYVNSERATETRFKPFGPAPNEDIIRQIDDVCAAMARQKETVP